jgi:hypothetical protein
MFNLMAPETHSWLKGVKHKGNVKRNPTITALKMHPRMGRF